MFAFDVAYQNVEIDTNCITNGANEILLRVIGLQLIISI